MRRVKSSLSVLEGILGEGHHTSKSNYIFFCPKCHHHKRKLEIEITRGLWHCWVCNKGGKSFSTLGKWLRWSNEVIRSLGGTPQLKSNKPITTAEREVVNILPAEYISMVSAGNSFLTNKAAAYLIKRGVTRVDVLRNNIGMAKSGRYKNMLIFPNYDRTGTVNYFTTRAFIGQTFEKFVNPPASKNIIGLDNQINWNLPVVVVEGMLDAVAVRFNVIPCYGKMTKFLRNAIIEHTPPAIYLALDADAIVASMDSAWYFINAGIPTYVVEFPEGADPSKLGFPDVWDYILDNCIEIDRDILLDFYMKTNLYGTDKSHFPYRRYTHKNFSTGSGI